MDPESIRIYLYENNFTELFDNLGILGEYTFESTNLFGAASDVVAKRRSKSMEIKLPRLMKMIRHLIVIGSLKE